MKLLLELVSKVSSASVDDMRAATSSNFAQQSSVYLSGYTSGCFARFPRLASHLANLATKLLLSPVLVVVLALGEAPSWADVAQELWHAETTGTAAHSLSLATYAHINETKTPAKLTLFSNAEHTVNSRGTLGLRVEIAHYAALHGFHFSDFEGPDAPARTQPLMEITIQRSSGLPLSFKLAPAGFVSSDATSDQPFFVFTVASPAGEPSIAKEILKALDDNARSLQIAITDMRDPATKLQLVAPITERKAGFAKLVEQLD
jgi:hypothetical protein